MRSVIVFCMVTCVLGAQDMSVDFSRMLSGAAFAGSVTGVCVMDSGGGVVFESGSGLRLTPASSMKPLAAGFLWMERGGGFVFDTGVELRGEIGEGGTLWGDVWVLPGGDPALASQQLVTPGLNALFDEIHSALYKEGVRCIDGKIRIAQTHFHDNPVPGTWPREDAGNYYGAGYHPLSVLDNSYDLCFSSREKPGQKPIISSVAPAIPNLSFESHVTVGDFGTGDQAYIFGGPEALRKSIYGTIPPGKGEFCIKGSIPDPAEFFADSLSRFLDKKGMQTNDHFYESETFPASRRIWTHMSPPLQAMAEANFRKSLNHYSDAFLFALNQAASSGWNEACDYMKKKIQDITGGPPPILYDGSGMSPANGISPAQIAHCLLHFTQKIPRPFAFIQTLTQDSQKPAIWLKSGSMKGVQAYSGYIVKNDNIWSFAIVTNKIDDEKRSEIRSQQLGFIRSLAK